MNDDFLYTSRPPVREAFSNTLKQRLAPIETNPARRKGVWEMLKTSLNSSAWKLAVPALLSVAMLIFAISEPVRAKTVELIRIVAGFTIGESNTSPIQPMDPATENTTASTGGIAMQTATPISMTVESTIVPIPTRALSDLLANPPFPFALPAWIPDGYTLDATAGIATSQNWVSLVWNHPDLREIEMLVEREYNGYTIPAGENSTEEIQIDGRPALLTRGFWDAQHQWDPRRGLTLDWEKDGRHYRLNYTERGAQHHEIVPMETDSGVILQELVKMAESVR